MGNVIDGLYGYAGNGRLSGEAGDDVIAVYSGDDTLDGGASANNDMLLREEIAFAKAGSGLTDLEALAAARARRCVGRQYSRCHTVGPKPSNADSTESLDTRNGCIAAPPKCRKSDSDWELCSIELGLSLNANIQVGATFPRLPW